MSEPILPLGPADAPEMQRLHAPLFDPPWSVEALADQLAAPGVGALGLGAPRLDGFVLFRVAADEAEILIIAVRSALQRRGLGGRLLAAAGQAAAGLGARALWLEVAVDNAPAIALYAKAGFAEAGRRPRYYRRSSGPPVDALLLRRALA